MMRTWRGDRAVAALELEAARNQLIFYFSRQPGRCFMGSGLWVVRARPSSCWQYAPVSQMGYLHSWVVPISSLCFLCAPVGLAGGGEASTPSSLLTQRIILYIHALLLMPSLHPPTAPSYKEIWFPLGCWGHWGLERGWDLPRSWSQMGTLGGELPPNSHPLISSGNRWSQGLTSKRIQAQNISGLPELVFTTTFNTKSIPFKFHE